jgi:hypothetical protein
MDVAMKHTQPINTHNHQQSQYFIFVNQFSDLLKLQQGGWITSDLLLVGFKYAPKIVTTLPKLTEVSKIRVSQLHILFLIYFHNLNFLFNCAQPTSGLLYKFYAINILEKLNLHITRRANQIFSNLICPATTGDSTGLQRAYVPT